MKKETVTEIKTVNGDFYIEKDIYDTYDQIGLQGTKKYDKKWIRFYQLIMVPDLYNITPYLKFKRGGRTAIKKSQIVSLVELEDCEVLEPDED